MNLLEVRNLGKHFGGLIALHNLDLDVHEAEILGLIGPNGAGKTTLFDTITAFLPPTSGKVLFRGQDITALRPDQITRMGLGRTFQTSLLFMKATVRENLKIGFHLHHKQPMWKAFLHTPSVRAEERLVREKIKDVLQITGLGHLEDELASNLPHGHQRILGVALALATAPKLLLMDEPATGMNPVETDAMVDLIREIRSRGIAVLIIEHDMNVIMNLCDRVVVLNFGNKIAEGSPSEIQNDERVIEAYLGRG